VKSSWTICWRTVSLDVSWCWLERSWASVLSWLVACMILVVSWLLVQCFPVEPIDQSLVSINRLRGLAWSIFKWKAVTWFLVLFYLVQLVFSVEVNCLFHLTWSKFEQLTKNINQNRRTRVQPQLCVPEGSVLWEWLVLSLDWSTEKAFNSLFTVCNCLR